MFKCCFSSLEPLDALRMVVRESVINVVCRRFSEDRRKSTEWLYRLTCRIDHALKVFGHESNEATSLAPIEPDDRREVLLLFWCEVVGSFVSPSGRHFARRSSAPCCADLRACPYRGTRAHRARCACRRSPSGSLSLRLRDPLRSTSFEPFLLRRPRTKPARTLRTLRDLWRSGSC